MSWKVRGGTTMIKTLSGVTIPRVIYLEGCAVDRHGVEYCGWLKAGHPWCPNGCELIEEEE